MIRRIPDDVQTAIEAKVAAGPTFDNTKRCTGATHRADSSCQRIGVTRLTPALYRSRRLEFAMTMTPETWTCSNCGEVIEPQFDACWNCATFRDGVAEEIAEDPDPQDENVAPETKLDQILQLQKKQNEALDEIRSKVGCLYVYMIVGILLSLPAGLLSFVN